MPEIDTNQDLTNETAASINTADAACDQPDRAATIAYDHEQFVIDLDVAIARVSDQVTSELPRLQRLAAPIASGSSMAERTSVVCLTLILRLFTIGRFADKVDQVLNQTRSLLIEKNKAYGNSALDPLRVFSSAGAREQILVRLDDKLSRLMRGSDAGEDTLGDMMGYIVLAEVAAVMDERKAATVSELEVAK